MTTLNRRVFLGQTALCAGGLSLGLPSCMGNTPDVIKGVQVRKMRQDLTNEEILGWGHAMVPGKKYSCLD